MARDLFRPLSEFLRASRKEWHARTKKENSQPELKRQAEYEAGIQYMEMGRYEEAITYLKKAMGSKVYRKEAYYYLAECYQHLNMTPLARRTYERLMRLDYNYRDVREKIQTLDSQKAPAPSPTWQPPPTQVSPSGSATSTMAVSEKDRYEILETIHKGEHSRIYRVKDKLLGRIIALKQIDHDYPDRTAYLQQMKERTALDHPNILRIYDIDEQQGQIAMEYVEGHDLRYTLRMKGALAPKMIIYIATQLINGLHQGHIHDIVHHTLTPEHILLTRQCRLKITAFRAPDSFMRLRKTDDPYKYLYIPPELFQKVSLTIASNIYSFGIILYEMFIGKTPFRLQELKAFVHQHKALTYDESPLLPGLQPIVRRCLASSPEQRYPNIRSIGEELIDWHNTYKRKEAHDDDISTYKDYLLMAWADGKITKQEAAFLAHKRQELHITGEETKAAEAEIKQELKELLRNA